MPGKKKGGKKKKIVRDEEWADHKHTFYGVVLKKAGGQHVDVMCHDGEVRKCYIRGKFRKRIWLDTDAVLLISYREELADDTKCDVIRKYMASEINTIRSRGHLDFHKGISQSFGGYGDDYDEMDKKEVQVRDNVDTSIIPLDDEIELQEESEDEDDSDDSDDSESEEESEEEVDAMGNTIEKKKVVENVQSNTDADNTEDNAKDNKDETDSANEKSDSVDPETSEESAQDFRKKGKKFVDAKKAKDLKVVDPKKRQKAKNFKNNRYSK